MKTANERSTLSDKELSDEVCKDVILSDLMSFQYKCIHPWSDCHSSQHNKKS